jgi:hypothetical protein
MFFLEAVLRTSSFDLLIYAQSPALTRTDFLEGFSAPRPGAAAVE